jgi:DNA-directed RNA polymerase specialized sigma24 family protein/phosphotransferase system HPr-like phosphotransfer protein
MPDRDDDEPLSHPHDKRVLATIRAVLLENRWPQSELEDGIATVEVRAWDTKPRPTTVGGWKALCRKIAKDMAVDRTRSEMAEGKESARPTDLADEHEAAHGGDAMEAAIDRRKAITEIAAQLSPEERPVFVKWALGSTQAEIAKELAMKPREVSRHVSTMRTRFQRVLAPVGLMAVLAIGAYFLFRDRLGPDEKAHNQVPSSVPSAPPGLSPEQLAQEQRAKADELRKVAAVECAAESWDKCYAHIDDASKLDPQGDEARGVQRLRSKANRGLIQQQLEGKVAPGARSLPADAKASFVAGLAASKGQALRVVCAKGAEPSRVCNQLVAAITSAGWAVTRTDVATDAGLPHGTVIDVAADADDATQAAADLLATGLERSAVAARGPNDAPPGGDAPLRLTIGPQ